MSPRTDPIESVAGGILLRLWIQPKASKSRVTGLHGDPPRIRIQIAAPPVDGAANEELLRFLKKALGVPFSSLRIVRGETSKLKDVECLGIDHARAMSLLALAPR
jgi:uncharacterized protein (TIGR00251 family)